MNNLKAHSLARVLLMTFFVVVIIQSANALASPSPLSPGTSYEPGEVIDTTTPELRWSGVSGAQYYSITISKYPYGPGDIVYNPQQISGTSTTVPANILVVGEKYRWNMRAGGSAGSWTLYFTVGSDSRQQPSGNTVSASARTTQQGTPAPTANATGLYSSQSTSGGGDTSFPLIIGGSLLAVIAGGGFFVMKRRSAPGNLPAAPSPHAGALPSAPSPPLSPISGQSIPGTMPAQFSTSTSLPAELLSQYQDVKYIGQGGFAKIFSAKQKDGKAVAIKVPLSMDPVTGKAFVSELQNWTRLEHENIVRIYDFNVIPVPYFEMELCDCSLAETKLPLAPADASWLLFQICEGLKYAHSHKIIHRDLKPQNILMKNGIPKLSDWGLSRFLTESKISSTQPSFTPYYAAPEQIAGKQKDHRTDIWQMGVIFYELVTGKLPFTGDSMIEVMSGIATKVPEPPSKICPAAGEVEPIISKCLKKDPMERYQSVVTLQRDLAANLKMNYSESMKKSVTEQDLKRSAYYCGDLLIVNMKIGDLAGAQKYASDLAHYAQGDIKEQATELADQIQMRLEMNIPEIPEELIVKADMIVHRVNLGFTK